MLTAVQLYHQTALKAHKINDIGPDRILSSEPISAQLPMTKVKPKSLFGFGGVLSEFSGPDYLQMVLFHLGPQCRESHMNGK